MRLAARTAATTVAVLLVLGVGLGLVVGPRLGNYRVLYVRTASMAPTLPVGSLVVVRPVAAEDVRPGDILTFAHPDDPARLVTHRVVRREGNAFVTQGDANPAPDQWRIPAAGSGWRHAAAVPGLGFVLGYLRAGALSTLLLAAAVLTGVAHALRLIWRS